MRFFAIVVALITISGCQKNSAPVDYSIYDAVVAQCKQESNAPDGATVERTTKVYSSKTVVKYRLAKQSGVDDAMRHHFEECYRNNKPK